ncbi:MBL fold metallo-hydrolase [Propylenella binzhouense]|uniref:MBL fold metallo-hydrolase n=1 Tax=Propylenella binzhouense TaxID=2555902 RepID=A0A964T6F1_9HYPH|nr:MBL fold metallo-hydrolase [Propylenella binzhouense]MYZ49269.1 MBL fold metallo-hydrolase [Propylenella binzhouense]
MTRSEALAIRAFFDGPTNTISYLVWDRESGKGAVIDPVLDFDHRSGKASTASADAVLAAAKEEGVAVEWILETHAHADHLSAAPYLKLRTGAQVGIGDHIRDVQRIFRPVFNLTDISGDGSEFDRLFADGETFRIGGLEAEVIFVPGHTPADVAYRIGDAVFVGDTLFMPDYGTARADFPGGDAEKLYDSMQRLLALPDETRLFMCHDYKAPGRDEYAWETTVAQEKRNVHLAGRSREEFVAWRRQRDAGLAAPLLLLPSIQTNIRAGRFPEAEANGVHYLKLPVKLVQSPLHA